MVNSPGAFRLPPPAGVFLVASGEDFHAVGEHERRVKPDPELPDQRQVGFFVAGKLLQKLERTAMGDGAQVFDEFIVSQADAGVFDRKNPLILVGNERNFQRGLVAVLLVGEFEIPHLVQGIGSIRDQFADRDLFVLIQRMRQQMQQLLDFGLKRELLFFVGFRHVVSFVFLIARILFSTDLLYKTVDWRSIENFRAERWGESNIHPAPYGARLADS